MASMVVAEPQFNRSTEAKVALGRRLFGDKNLSIDRTVSCATCHDPERAFADGRPLAIGISGRIGRRNSPTLVNRGFGRLHFWDGATPTLEEQVLLPISAPTRWRCRSRRRWRACAPSDDYRAEFARVLGAEPTRRGTAGRAVATFVRGLTPVGRRPVDRFAPAR